MAGPVMLGYVWKGGDDSLVHETFMASVLSLVTGEDASPLIGGIAKASAGALVSEARNLLTAQFLKSRLEWLWCVDTDMVFTPLTLAALMQAADRTERPVVSALAYILDQGRAYPSVYSVKADNGELDIKRADAVPDDQLMPVGACGAACLLIHRAALTEIKAAQGPVWWHHMNVGGHQLGEDISFSLRCAAAGIPVHVHTGIGVGHVKAAVIGDVT